MTDEDLENLNNANSETIGTIESGYEETKKSIDDNSDKIYKENIEKEMKDL